MLLQHSMHADGYTKVDLELNAIEQFTIALRYCHNTLNMILDTGASSTVVAIDRARELDFQLETLSIAGAGVGTSAAGVFKLPTNTVHLGDVAVRDLPLYAMDLSHVNDALGERGASTVDGVVGMDLLTTLNAVLSVRDHVLYLHQV